MGTRRENDMAEWDRLVNNKWYAAGHMGDNNYMPPPTDKQAAAGIKRIHKKFMGYAFRGKVVKAKRRNQYTWQRYEKGQAVFVYNQYRKTPRNMTGWADMAHCMAHYIHSRQRPNERPHSQAELALETEITNFVLSPAFDKYRLPQ